MQRIPPSTQMQEALRQDLAVGFAGHPLRQFVRRAAELLLQVGALYIGATERQQAAAWRSDRRRVVCLGDSNVYGLWMQRDQTFPAYLEHLWNAAAPAKPVEVLNLGFPGLNSSKMRKSFRGLMQALRPDLVLVLVGSNDINSVAVPLDDGNDGGTRVGYSLWQHSRVFRLLYMLAAGVRETPVKVDVDYSGKERRGVVRIGDTEFDLAGTDRLVTTGFTNWDKDLRTNLNAMAADAAAVGATFVVLTYPSHLTLYGTANLVLGVTDNLPLIDLATPFRRLCPDGNCPDIFLADQHPTAEGYQLAAALVLRRLRELGLAEPSPEPGAGLDDAVRGKLQQLDGGQ